MGGTDHIRAGVPAGTDSLVGRDAELRIVDQLLASEGGGALVLAGEPGIGKTSLLIAAQRRARAAGFTVLSAAGSEGAAEVPFQGLHRLLAGLLDRVSRLPSAQRRALLTALGVREGPAPQPFLVALATLDVLVEAAAEAPVLVCVDDLQWLDQPSADALAFVARRLGYDPIVLLATSRTHAGERPVPADLPRVDLGRLTAAEATALVRRARADLDPVARDHILTRAEGNPLALVELAASWTEAGLGTLLSHAGDHSDGLTLTERLERAFVGRLRDLPQATRDAILVAAADSGDQHAEILAAASLLTGRQLTLDDLQPAVGTGLVRFDDLRVRFRHPLVRSGVLQEATPLRLRSAHEALARQLAGDPYRATWHRALALDAPDEEVAAQLEANHRIALQRGSALTAIRVLERAAELSPEPADAGRRLLLAAEHGFGLGRADLVRRLLSAAAREDLPELERARMTWLEQIFEDGMPGDPAPVLELCALAERSAAVGDVSLAFNLLMGAALRCWWAETGREARSRVVAVTRGIAAAEHDPRHVAVLATADPIREAAEVRRLLLKAGQDVTITGDVDNLRLLGQAAHAVGETELAADFLDRAEARLRAQGRLGLLPQVLGMQIQVRLDLGDWRLAAQAAEEGHRLAVDTGQPIWSAGTLVGDAKVAALHGDTATALRLASEVDEQLLPRGIDDLLACAQLVRGIALLVDGRADEACTALVDLFDRSGPYWNARESFGGVGFLADAAARAGRQDEAREAIGRARDGWGECPAALLQVNLRYADAVLTEDEEAEKPFHEALAADLVRWPWPRARLELAYGSWLRRRRRGAESRSPLRAALTVFEAMGARPWAELARQELRAAGHRAPIQQDVTVAQLTPQELQIAKLAAEGLSNRQIGHRLYLSPRTVGSHLYRVFPKLGITARAQLAEALKAL
ncbi:helix-turn-helix transcriptional regulator [Streptomyces griseorubiginosus]|uniref:helix-turn-helix transcriptional regulator n=1 Tax=Streptomyces griseorubiginosus TaxID=67304 RepID=UPI001AD64352|nr:LuxR family transcriptional regulator [Streptomyces griseorubiginosus]MBO4252442.1 AAA family ATPase [Streptomyces griseorubiginosus]